MAIDIKHPENTKDTLYIHSPSHLPWDMNSIITLSKSHFGDDVDLDKLNIHSEHIQVYGLNSELVSFSYDPSDYQDFIVITKE